jgi:hypothetical protein
VKCKVDCTPQPTLTNPTLLSPNPPHPQDPAVPVRWLGELFEKYVPDCIAEMACSYSHITPLGGWGALPWITLCAG